MGPTGRQGPAGRSGRAPQTMAPVPQMTWNRQRKSHSDTLVLSPDTPFQSRYRSVRIGVFSGQETQSGDERLPANALVVGVEGKAPSKATT